MKGGRRRRPEGQRTRPRSASTGATTATRPTTGGDAAPRPGSVGGTSTRPCTPGTATTSLRRGPPSQVPPDSSRPWGLPAPAKGVPVSPPTRPREVRGVVLPDRRVPVPTGRPLGCGRAPGFLPGSTAPGTSAVRDTNPRRRPPPATDGPPAHTTGGSSETAGPRTGASVVGGRGVSQGTSGGPPRAASGVSP